jgi:hypothetical protein
MSTRSDSRRPVLQCELLESRLVPDATSFVKSLYVNLLNRTADSSGLANWVSQIQSGGLSNAQVADDFWRSTEHRIIEVTAYYENFLGRAPDPSGLAFWVNEMTSGTLNEIGVAERILSSSEYLSSHNTPAIFIQGLYLDVLARLPSASESVAWENVLATAGAGVVAADILTSAEAYTGIINNDYLTYLGRTADASGLAHWLSKLETGQGTVETVADGILGSAEYANLH